MLNVEINRNVFSTKQRKRINTGLLYLMWKIDLYSTDWYFIDWWLSNVFRSRCATSENIINTM